MSRLDIEDRVFAEDFLDDDSAYAPCMWFALCDNPANGLRDAGPLGPVPICQRCDDKMERIAST